MRLGFVTELLSKSIRYGDMNGIALAALTSQLPKLFGFSVSVPRASIPPWAPPSTPTSKSTRWIGNHENSTDFSVYNLALTACAMFIRVVTQVRRPIT